MQRKVLPAWLAEMQANDFEEGDDEYEEFKRALKEYENTDEGAEFTTEWEYNKT